MTSNHDQNGDRKAAKMNRTNLDMLFEVHMETIEDIFTDLPETLYTPDRADALQEHFQHIYTDPNIDWFSVAEYLERRFAIRQLARETESE